MRSYFIAGNWKMNMTVEESVSFIRNLHEAIVNMADFPLSQTEVVVFPPFTSLYAVKGLSNIIRIGAQNISYGDQGAFTGEVSPLMLKGLAEYVIVGHSERRELFRETDEDINKKLKTALRHGFTPVFCIGESLAEREGGATFRKLETQLERGLAGLSPDDISRLVMAYEPVWAIGTGVNASPEQAQEVHIFIRDFLKNKISHPETMKIIYGGSVKPENTCELLKKNDINGALIGNSSLKVDLFSGIIQLSVSLVR